MDPWANNEPGDPIGIRTIQHILMSQTQMSLSHFHTAGMSELGIDIRPSIADTMNNKYTKENTSMKFEIEQNVNLRGKLIGVKFVNIVKDIGSSMTGLPDKENIWYKVLNKDIPSSNILRFYIDYNKMRYYNLTLQQIAENIFNGDCKWNISPDFMGMIDIYLPSQYLNIWLQRLDSLVCGSLNILSVKDSTDNKLITVGSDILAVSKLDVVKVKTLVSNNVKEVEKYYGIEAAQYVLNILLNSSTISNFMTRTGNVQPFNKSSHEIYHKGLLFAMGLERPKDDIRRCLKNPSLYTGKSVYTDIINGVDPTYNFKVYDS